MLNSSDSQHGNGDTHRYSGRVAARSPQEETKLGRGIEVFDEDVATSLNDARLEHLASLGLDINGKRVLDAGCGVGHLSRFFVARGCSVVCVDVRTENVAELKRRHPETEAHVADVESDDLSRFGEFDIVFCYGLLYHLENPIVAMRNLRKVCRGLLILETNVCDSDQPVLKLVDESLSSNQATGGIGSRPSPSFVAFALNRIGFRHVYQPIEPPDHRDFDFEWNNDLSDSRDGHPNRCVFFASTAPVECAKLTSLLDGQ